MRMNYGLKNQERDTEKKKKEKDLVHAKKKKKALTG